jgi:glycosyltransferase involved in cell wall biosynthesis
LENIELWRKILSNLTTEEMVELEGSKVEFFSELYRHFVKNRMNPSISAYILSRLLREVRNSDDYTEIISLLRSVSHQKGLNPLLSNKRNLQEILRNISPKEESPRVVFWSDNWEYLGGLNRMIVRIAKCIAPFFDVFICSWKGLGRTSGFKIPSNIIYREFTRRNYSIEDLPLIMSLLQVDIFICSNAYSIEYLKLCSLLKDYGIKVIVWDHSHYFLAHRQEELHELAVKRLQLLKNVERIVCVNQLSNKIYKSFELPSISINNIVGEKFQKGLNSESSNKAHRAGNTLVAVGRFDEYQKRLDLLIEVFAKIQNQVPDAILYVLGSYNLDIEVSSAMESRETYRQMIRRLGIDEKRIIFKGNVRNIEDYYKKASIQILSSEYEGFGLVILEAACFGTPTVAFSGNGADYIIKNGVNGFLIENYDVDKMASVISSLLTEKNKLARISSNCRKLIDGYTEDKIIPQWIDLINMVNKGESLRGSSYNFSSSETQFVIHEFEKMLSERYREIAWVKYKNGELNNEINLIRNSITWKITKPFRKLEHLFELFKTQGVVRTCKNIILRIYEVALGKR